ncbi:MAG TPA: hypothetical protein VFG04_11490, partial [Planctomycetaceae bacterium]|nr:hypothetical protein [Planctomycetaceae bacterium]
MILELINFLNDLACCTMTAQEPLFDYGQEFEFIAMSSQPSGPLVIATIDCSRDDAAAALATLRGKLSPQGNVVSEAGRRRTIEIFSEPLSPQQVVERICRDVRERGLEAVLDYGRKLDKKDLAPETLR